MSLQEWWEGKGLLSDGDVNGGTNKKGLGHDV